MMRVSKENSQGSNSNDQDQEKVKNHSSKLKSFAVNYLIAFAAGACAEMATYPLDLVKTRMQITGELDKGSAGTGSRSKVTGGGMWRTFVNVVRCEGPLEIFRGLSPAIYRQAIYMGVRMTLYEKLRDDVIGKDATTGQFPVYKAALTSLFVGAVAQFAASPTDLVRVQLQMEGRRRLEGKPPPRVKGALEAFSKIYKEAGVKGLWRGSAPNVQRGALVNLGDITTYDSAKRWILHNTRLNDGIGVHAISSLISGFTAALLATPADVILTRVMNQPTKNGRGLYYKNSVDCLRVTLRNEGVRALYKGLIPNWMRLGPHSMTFWVLFEKFRSVLGVSSF